MNFAEQIRQKLVCVFVLSAGLGFTSCEKEELINEAVASEETTQSSTIQLGRKVDSPLLLRNMQRAADTLASRTQLRHGVTLSATHYYVRFLPTDSTEYERLVAEKSLDFTPYPLDYEVSEGDYYHDATLPAEAITWQYTTVSADYDLDKLNVHYEKLEDLYILDEDLEAEDVIVGSNDGLRSGTSISWKDLVTESAIQTGHLGRQSLRAQWTPSATIMAYDDLLGKYIPLQGVKVRIRYFAFLKAYHYTDQNGYVSFGGKNTSVEYSIEWEREMWDIRDGGTQAYYHGPEQKSAWNLKIGSGTPKSLHISAIHRALQKYYYGDICGLTRPSKDLKISYEEGWASKPVKGSTYPAVVRTWSEIFSAIKIYGKRHSTQETYKSHDVFSTTLHELTHASHACRMDKNTYDNVDHTIKESWASAIQWYLSLDEYKKLGAKDFELNYKDDWLDLQEWGLLSTENIEYTPLFIDLYDSFNQSKRGEDKPNDNISGYRFKTIDQELKSLQKFTDVESFVIANKPDNVSLSQINLFFNIFKQKWVK